ncbi:metalloregulator ArsR/SmtB family transcription factor [Hoeflea sp. YIM 152468]|uniref:ArsR/SmtB family transcription factor n=1 Tax=Hoeflea sp. YIM 152468 TaxID=3031759 RepID=UPI0023DC7DBA|nr:metalloregulator ArsR/SmtB family transcription factor [Hoeflea sp. YIM 152468]MDF1608182.1 metalloregulator ArsR/SmtB family transcription factor [Hoeflea sp. YIM 152468]
MAKHDPDLSPLFHALADPTRRSMLTRLAAGPAPVTELASPTGLALPTVMRHLSVLEVAGLIATSKDGRVRTCAIVPEALAPMQSWLDEQRLIWESRLDRLDDYVKTIMKERER